MSNGRRASSIMLAVAVAAGAAISAPTAKAIEYLFPVCAGGDFADRCSAAELQVDPITITGPSVSFDGLTLSDFGFGFADRERILVRFLGAGTLVVSRTDDTGAQIPLLASTYDETRATIGYTVTPQPGHYVAEAVFALRGVSASGNGVVDTEKYMIHPGDPEGDAPQTIRLACDDDAVSAPGACPIIGALGFGVLLPGQFAGGFFVTDFLLAELQGGSAGAATMMELSQSFFAPIPAPGSLLLLGTALLAVMAGGPWNRRDGAQPRRDPRNASVAAASSDGPSALARMTTA